MNDNLSASFVLMAGAAFLAFWFYHLTGAQRTALLAKARAADPSGGAGGLAPYMPKETIPAGGTPGAAPGYDAGVKAGAGYFPQTWGPGR